MSKERVLVVDNNPVLLKIVVNILEGEGCEVHGATDGLEAMDVIADFKPDVIFTDLVMPKIDGSKLCYIVRNTPELKDIFLVVLSGIGIEDDLNLNELEADVYIVKGPASLMKKHVIAALNSYRKGERHQKTIRGGNELSSREITKELLSSLKHNNIVLDRMTEGVVELDKSGRVVMVNRAARAILKQPEEVILSSNFSIFFQGEVKKKIDGWLARLDTPNPVSLFFDYDDSIEIGDKTITLHLVPAKEENIVFAIGILSNISKRKIVEKQKNMVEKELRRIQKLEAVSMMASGIAHDFNNLLSVISGNVEMARMLSADNPEIISLLDESRQAVRMTTDLVRKFTTFSDNYLPAKTRVRLSNLFEKAVQSHYSGTEFNVVISSEDDLWQVDVDSEFIEQVFLNIIQNSFEAMEGKGTVTIFLSNVEGKDELNSTEQAFTDRQFVKILIEDEGVGIDEKIKHRIFDPYFSTKLKGAQKGMGLGLTISHAIVSKHGGHLWVDSEEGEGCKVTLYLPAGSWTDRYQENSTVSPARRRVLIMDDDEMMRIICSKLFKFLDCEVDVADEGGKAVQLFAEALQNDRRYDMVGLDLRVSLGMSGVDAAKKIWELEPDVKMVAISGDCLDPVMMNFSKYHFTATLPKPFTLDIVEELLSQLDS